MKNTSKKNNQVNQNDEYRWRELRSEKPEIREKIIISYSFLQDEAVFACFLGLCDIKDINQNPYCLFSVSIPFSHENVLKIYDSHSVKWRKMFKMPKEQ